jgi:glutaconate CoA-transferase subunit B
LGRLDHIPEKAQQRHGFVGGGRSAIVTMLGVLQPPPDSHEFALDGGFPFLSVEAIEAHIGGVLKFAALKAE